jgi:Acetyltransferase (GNAT) family
VSLFAAGPLHARRLLADDVPPLQRFFEAHPLYFQQVHGQPPAPDEAQQEFEDLPPAGMTYTEKWLLGFFDEGGELQGMATVWSDFLAPRVWHIGLFIIATPLHGSGVAHGVYGALEAWMRQAGATWLRLGVVQGHTRAECFWLGRGYAALRERGPITMGQQDNIVRVMVKPLHDATLGDYLALVARDRPDSP